MEDATARLEAEEILWLTTVRTDGQPQTSPVWFVWQDDVIHVVSEPGAGKVTNIAANPHVSAHLEGAGPGALVVTIEGDATLADGLDADAAAAYAEKYETGLRRLGMTATAYLATFATGIRITPTRWRAFPSD